MRRRLVVQLSLLILPLALVSAFLAPAASAGMRSAATLLPRVVHGIAGHAQRHAVINVRDLPRSTGFEGRTVAPNMPAPARPTFAGPAGSGTPAPARWTNPSTSPSPSASFAALGDNNTSIPPDTMGAVGPTQLLTMLNSQFIVQNKSGGTVQAAATLDSFWAGVDGGTTGGSFDPRVIYDAVNDRWIVAAGDDGDKTTSAIFVGASRTSDATGTWDLFRIPVSNTSIWADYPTLGFDKNWVVVSVNMFNVSGGLYNSARVYAIDKTQLYSSHTESHQQFPLTSSPPFTIVPAVDQDNTSNTEYLLDVVGIDNVTHHGYYRISTISGSVGSASLTLGSLIDSGKQWAYAPNNTGADFAPQLGTSNKIQNNDSRMQNVVLQGGQLWFTHTVFLPYNAPTRAAVQWGELTTGGSVTQLGRVDDISGAHFYAFPSIGVNSEDDVLLGYSSFGSGQYAAADYSFRLGSDTASTLEGDVVVKAGEAPYYKVFSGTQNRWGDYSMVSVDPADDMTLWSLQEYAKPAATGGCSPNCDRWGTWWGAVTPTPSPGTLSFSSATYSVKQNAGSITITVTRTGGSSGAVGVHYATSDGSAVAGIDYTTASGDLSFADGVTSQTFIVPILAESGAPDANETVNLTLSSPTGGATLGTSSAVLTIVGDIYKPDGKIKLAGDASYIGNNVYNLTGTNQTRTVNATRGSTKTFDIAVQDDGNLTDSYKLKGLGSTTTFTVKYLAGLSGTTDITSAVVAGTYTLSSIAVQGTKYIRMVITVKSGAAIGINFGRLVTITSTHQGTAQDAPKGVVHTVT